MWLLPSRGWVYFPPLEYQLALELALSKRMWHCATSKPGPREASALASVECWGDPHVKKPWVLTSIASPPHLGISALHGKRAPRSSARLIPSRPSAVRGPSLPLDNPTRSLLPPGPASMLSLEPWSQSSRSVLITQVHTQYLWQFSPPRESPSARPPPSTPADCPAPHRSQLTRNLHGLVVLHLYLQIITLILLFIEDSVLEIMLKILMQIISFSYKDSSKRFYLPGPQHECCCQDSYLGQLDSQT